MGLGKRISRQFRRSLKPQNIGDTIETILRPETAFSEGTFARDLLDPLGKTGLVPPTQKALREARKAGRLQDTLTDLLEEGPLGGVPSLDAPLVLEGGRKARRRVQKAAGRRSLILSSLFTRGRRDPSILGGGAASLGGSRPIGRSILGGL